MPELQLYGTVGASWWDEDYFTAKQVREQLATMSGDLVVRMNSGGGIATEGQAIYTALVDYPGQVTVIVDGVAASAASLIAMAGDEIVMRRGAWMLIHDPANPWTIGRGTEDDHLKEAAVLGVISNAYAEIYAAKSGMSRAEARKIMKGETVLDGTMCVDMGFATRVEGDEEALPAAAFDYRIYKNAPADLKAGSERLGKMPGQTAVMAMLAGTYTRTTVKEASMPDDPKKAVEAPSTNPAPVAAVTPPAPAPVADTQAAVQAERVRARRIADATAAAGLPATFGAQLIEEGLSADVALDRISAEWKAKGGADTPATGRETARILRDERDTMRTGMTAAIHAQLARVQPAGDEGQMARPFMDQSLAEMAAQAVGYRGSLRTAADRVRVFEMATHSTSDFPVIFENALNKRLLDSYLKAAPTYQQVAMRADFTDFRPHPIDRIGDFPTMLPVAEGGEIKFGTFGEKKESVLLAAYGRAMAITRQMLVNDDMGAIDRLISSRGQMVAAFEDATFWAVWLSGANADGPTLTETTRQVFNTNVADNTKAGTPAAISITSLTIARAALRNKKSIDGQFLNAPPAILICGPAKETEAQQIVAPIQAAQVSNANVFAGTLRLVVTPYITDNAWYVIADPGVLPIFMYGFLQGSQGPRFRMDEPFGVQGIRFSIEEDFGAGAIDFRGGFKNAGA